MEGGQGVTTYREGGCNPLYRDGGNNIQGGQGVITYREGGCNNLQGGGL